MVTAFMTNVTLLFIWESFSSVNGTGPAKYSHENKVKLNLCENYSE